MIKIKSCGSFENEENYFCSNVVTYVPIKKALNSFATEPLKVQILREP